MHTDEYIVLKISLKWKCCNSIYSNMNKWWVIILSNTFPTFGIKNLNQWWCMINKILKSVFVNLHKTIAALAIGALPKEHLRCDKSEILFGINKIYNIILFVGHIMLNLDHQASEPEYQNPTL